jgi:DNA-binding GntR family transcriptional regulator
MRLDRLPARGRPEACLDLKVQLGRDRPAAMMRIANHVVHSMNGRNVPEFFKHSVAFTCAVHRHCGNKTLARMLDVIDKQAPRYRYLAHAWTHEMLEVCLRNYKEVREAIALRNAPMAQRRGTRMIRQAHAVIARAMSEAYPGLETKGDALP